MEDGPRRLFFCQAEDGIRDADVTGVQTCALPIFLINDRMIWRAIAGGDVSHFVGDDERSLARLVMLVAQNDHWALLHDASKPLKARRRKMVERDDGDASSPDVAKNVVQLDRRPGVLNL